VKPLHRRHEVILDLAEIHARIAEADSDTAERFLAAVELTFQQIGKNPGIGWQRSWRNRKLQGLRSWRVERFPNFLIFYPEELDTIEIYAVLRGSRHLVRALTRRE